MTTVPRFAHGSRVPGWDDSVDLTKEPAGVPDLAVTPVPAELRAEIEASMGKYPDRRSAAIPALHAAQRQYGWCSPAAVEQVAAVMRLTPAYLMSVATFYDMFETVPKGAHDVYVCTNISCSMRGADALYEAMLDAAGDDPSFNIQSFECLGACDIAPMASVNGEYLGPLEPADTQTIVADVKAGRPVLESKQLRFRRAVDPGVAAQVSEQGAASEWGPPADAPTADTAGLDAQPDDGDRLGPSAPVEYAPEAKDDSV